MCIQNNTAVPLASYRLAVKDLFHMAGLPTSAGNPDWLSSHPLPLATSPVVTNLIQHGARFVGKTLTDELAYSLNGQNKHYGTPENPAAPDRLPGGSSSGSATAVSLNLADIGLGTDTGGSIRVPASYQGLFGLRPTHGEISTDHMVALAPSFDTVGVMTRDLTTLENTVAVLLPHLYDTETLPLSLVTNLTDSCGHREAILQWHETQASLHPELFMPPGELTTEAWQTGETFRVIQGHEIWQQHGHWLSNNRLDIASDIQLRLNSCAALTSHEVNEAKQRRDAFNAWFSEVVSNRILVMPTTPGISPLLSTPAESLAGYRNQLLSLTSLAGLSGCPQLHLPLFSLNNAPCGLSLLGPRGSDRQLLKIARTLLSGKQQQ
ncbi:MAG: amidase [Pseudomonadota bacterium]|nr:amidase [Pseudomonadota bacterium]